MTSEGPPCPGPCGGKHRLRVQIGTNRMQEICQYCRANAVRRATVARRGPLPSRKQQKVRDLLEAHRKHQEQVDELKRKFGL